MTQGRFMIIDGNSLVYRAFYALPLLSNKKGIFTNAVYGFTNMLLKILNEEEPACIAIAFDKGKVTFRTEQYQEYKAHRKATPDELRPQFPIVKDIVRALRIPVYELAGYEADDIIGTVALKAEEQGYQAVIVTGDRDALQLVSDKTRVMLTKKGISEMELYDEARVQERYGIKPDQVIDIKGLMGDSSDNIPGVPGVGEKTAIKLIQQYGTVEELLAKKDEVAGKLGEKIRTYADQAILSKQLATIVRDVPMELDLRECTVEEPDWQLLLQIGEELEFKALVKMALDKLQQSLLPGIEPKPAEEKMAGDYQEINLAELESLVNELERGKETGLVFDLSPGSPMEAACQGIAVSWENGRGYYASFQSDRDLPCLKNIFRRMTELKTNLIMHDAKTAKVALHKYGLDFQPQFDTMLAAYLLNPSSSTPNIGSLCSEFLGKEVETVEGSTSICTNADLARQLQGLLDTKLHELDMAKLYYEVEMPLLELLAEMELTGVALNAEFLADMSKELGAKIDTLVNRIYETAGETFNINSTKQLGVILFEKLMLPVVKKTKTGYSTDVEVLETLAERHEIVASILEYRQLVKLKSTYVDGLSGLIAGKTAKVHTTFNQAVTATGRLSSTEPNLQNIPIRMEEGRRIRKAFVPSEQGWKMFSADYSQIELRILAHLSGDEKFVQAFRENEDIHTRTAAEVFGVPLEEVTRDMRSQAKAVNFGIVYGISDFGLAKNIGVGRKEAKQYIGNYFARYNGVKEYLDDSIRQAKETGFVTTMLNRRRYLPDLLSPNKNIRSFGERTAMNTPIQGSAADIIKLAMVHTAKCLKDKNLRTRMLLQVHDELIFEVPPEELATVIPLIKQCMESAVQLKVPLKVDMKVGANWYDMEKIND